MKNYLFELFTGLVCLFLSRLSHNVFQKKNMEQIYKNIVYLLIF